jgi:cysteine desulfurase
MHANNEVGTLQPVAELAALTHAHGACHTDAAAVSKIPVCVYDVDLLSPSGHKFGGPKGTGALWAGGDCGCSRSRRAASRNDGHENVAVSQAWASRLNMPAALDQHARRSLTGGSTRAGPAVGRPGTAVNGAPGTRVPNTTNISVDGVEAELLLMALDLDGISVSTGSACSSGSLEPSHVLKAMGLPVSRARTSLRFSLGPETTDAEIDTVIACMPPLVDKLRRLSHTAASVGAGRK